MGGEGEPYEILYKQVTNFGVIKFAVSKFIFRTIMVWACICRGGGEYAITVSKIIIEL